MGSWRNRLSLAADYRAGRPEVRGYPISVTAETTTRCNLQCPMCLRVRDDLPPQDMPRELFERLWKTGRPSFDHLILYGLGEPLCDPDFLAKAALAARRCRAVQVSTNALLLDENRARALLDSGINQIIFSLDAARPETYARLRPGGDYATTVQNIEAFLRLNEERGRPVFTVVQLVVLPENRAEADEFLRRWKRHDVGAARLKRDEVRPHDPAAKPARLAPCPVLWRGPFYVRADGAVLPCCHHHHAPPLGNLKTDRLADLWNHPRIRELRRAHAAGEGNAVPYCDRCFLATPSRGLTALSFLPSIELAQRLLPWAERRLMPKAP
jgi:radical SAM protein with 4Fe4S-binding SPASM domain